MNAKFDIEKAWAVAIMRIGMGLLFFLAAVTKFAGGLGKFRENIYAMFAKTWLPHFALVPYVYALPFVEITVGALLILGLFRCFAFGLAMPFMLSLTFGMIVVGKIDIIGINMTYLFFLGALLCVSSWDRFTLDYLLGWLKKK